MLKVEKEEYYIIDTLGEILFEGCNQGYVLKFDKETVVYQFPEEQKLEDEKCSSTHQSAPTENSKYLSVDISKSPIVANGNWPKKETSLNKHTNPYDIVEKREWKERFFCKGKELCKEFIKGFWEALPLWELHMDIKKGLMGRTPLHHRLQIEFQFIVHSCSTSMDLVMT